MTQTRLAVDIGGTFTDVVLETAGNHHSTKVPTTPSRPEDGFLDGFQRILKDTGINPSAVDSIIHGTTLATNALIERKGARTALLTTKGFRDSLEIGYEARYDQYDLDLEKTPPLVPRRHRFEVTERVLASGKIDTPLDVSALQDIADALKAANIEALAIGFLHSYVNDAHERQARDILAPRLPGVSICISSEVCPEIREYERLSTTVANAYVRPKMAGYLSALMTALRAGGYEGPLFMVTSAGAMTSVDAAKRFPIRLVESGPSGGAVLAEMTAEACGEKNVLSYDMGGTTAKICLLDNYRASTAREFEAARAARFQKGSGLPLRIPVVEMIEIGAGGGSLAHMDAMGRIAVGPESAGAEPGPICYAKGGTVPAVTDADLLLGRLDADKFAEGRLKLDTAATTKNLDAHLGADLALESQQVARGISEMVDEAMANAARVHAVEHAKDLRDFTMIAFGGAGPLHAGRLAEKLGIKKLIIPNDPGVGSAVGFLSMPISSELIRSHYMTLGAFDAGAATQVLVKLETDAAQIVDEASGSAPRMAKRTALMRYVGQGHEIEIPVPGGELDAESAEVMRVGYALRYGQLYGRALPDGEIEILSWAVTVSTMRADVQTGMNDDGQETAAIAQEVRDVLDSGTNTLFPTPIYARRKLASGATISGPALVVEAQTTTVVPASFDATVNSAGFLVLTEKADAGPVATTSAATSTLEQDVMWSRLQSIVDEIAGVLMRTAFSPIVRESGDLSVGIFDADGRMLTQAVTGTPGHVNSMATACAKFFGAFPRQNMKPGDIYLTNDPWLGSGHLNDFVLLQPVFHEAALIGFVSCTSHLVDIGGRCLGPDGSDVFDEGLYIPHLKLVDEGALNDTFLTLLKANSRAPLQAEGDVFALIACCETGASRMAEMMVDFQLTDLFALADKICTASEQAVRRRIAKLPDGDYSYDMTVDGYEDPITIKATLSISTDGMHIDFIDSAPPSTHGINVPLNYAEAYAVFGLKCVVAPDIPNNFGSLAPFTVSAKEGTILNAKKPQPVCSRHILGQLLPDVALGCMAQVTPDAVPAEGAATLWDLPMKGLDPATGESFAAELVHNGGTGARATKDGLSATAFPSGVMGSLVEITESTTPIVIRARHLRTDSGGAGKQRGGLGQVIELEAVEGTPLTIYGTVDRVLYPARGHSSAGSGVAGAFAHSAGEAFYGKGACVLKPGEHLSVLTPGGGGYGPAFERAPDAVADDVRDGLVSQEGALNKYGVVITDSGEIDWHRTKNHPSRRPAGPPQDEEK